MALYMLNVCIDAPDVLTYLPENLSYNDQESIIEVVLEKVLGYENAIPEYDDNDFGQTSILKTQTALDFFTLPPTPSKSNHLLSQMTLPQDVFYLLNIPTRYLDTITPPPQI